VSHSTFSCLFSRLASRRRYETEQDCGSASQLTLADQELSSEECEICLIPFDKEDHVKVIPRDCVSKLFGALAGEVPLLQGIEPLVWRASPPNHPDPLITFRHHGYRPQPSKRRDRHPVRADVRCEADSEKSLSSGKKEKRSFTM